MADENLDMESVRISELDQTTEVDRANDYLVVSRHSDAYIDDEKSFKITPDDLLAGVGVNYNAGDHIAIDNNTHTISATYTNATTSADGLMSKEDKSTVDSLKPVATSGDYDDLTNKPTIPAAQVNSDWNSNSGVSEILNKPTLATVATTGDYADLSNTPIIPDAISDLTDDVSITNPENDEVLKYDATSSKWINAAAPAGASALSGLTDVAISTPLNNQALLYDNTTHTWINKAVEGTVPVKDTASGAIATFETNMADVLQEVKCEINASGGNGTPDNPNPIVGYTEANITRCGVNLMHVDSRVSGTIASVTYTSDDNYLYLNGTNLGGGYADLTALTVTLPKGTYYLKAFAISGTASNTVELYAYDGSTNLTGSLLSGERTLTLTETTTFRFRFAIWADGTVCTNYKVGIMISTASISEYSEYTGNTYTIAFGQTVYGGQLDVTRGKLHVTHGGVDLGDLTYTHNAGSLIGVPCFLTSVIDDMKMGSVPFMCSALEIKTPNRNNINGDGQIAVSNNTDAKYFVLRYDAYTSGSDVKTALTGQKLVYELATPIDIDLTPEVISAVAGANSVWHDSNGDTEVKYYTSTAKDIKDFIKTSIDVDDLADVTITTPSENQVLKYNGTQWVNATSPAGATNLDGLTDVTIATPTQGQSLVYNSTSGEWENTAVDYANIANTPTLATVATSGSYNDLSNKPTIPAAQVNADWDSTSGVSEILNKPTIPTVNDATITVVQGTTTKGTFTLNQGTDATITLDSGSGGASALDDLTDVTITNPSTDQILKYNGSQWVNATGSGGTPWIEVFGTLVAGNTTLTLTNEAITSNSTIQPFENVGAYSDIIRPNEMVVTTGQVVLTFDAQSTDLSVKVRVS